MAKQKTTSTEKKITTAQDVYAELARLVLSKNSPMRFFDVQVSHPSQQDIEEQDTARRRAFSRASKAREKYTTAVNEARTDVNFARGRAPIHSTAMQSHQHISDAMKSVDEVMEGLKQAFNKAFTHERPYFQLATEEGFQADNANGGIGQLCLVNAPKDIEKMLNIIKDDMRTAKNLKTPPMERFTNLFGNGHDMLMLYPKPEMIDKLRKAVEAEARSQLDREADGKKNGAKEKFYAQYDALLAQRVNGAFEQVEIDEVSANRLHVSPAIAPVLSYWGCTS